MSSTVTQLADLLGKTRRPGDFYARGKGELLPPSLSVVQLRCRVADPDLHEESGELQTEGETAQAGSEGRGKLCHLILGDCASAWQGAEAHGRSTLRSESGDIPPGVWSLPLCVNVKDEQIENF